MKCQVMKKVIKTCSVNPGLVSIGFMHNAKLSDLILSVKGSNRGLVLLRLAVERDHSKIMGFFMNGLYLGWYTAPLNYTTIVVSKV